jgi:hypothetical protein
MDWSWDSLVNGLGAGFTTRQQQLQQMGLTPQTEALMGDPGNPVAGLGALFSMTLNPFFRTSMKSVLASAAKAGATREDIKRVAKMGKETLKVLPKEYAEHPDKVPQVFLSPSHPRDAHGRFNWPTSNWMPNSIELYPKTFREQWQLAETMPHEAFHWLDFIKHPGIFEAYENAASPAAQKLAKEVMESRAHKFGKDKLTEIYMNSLLK